ncbi:MAG: protein kinase [Thermodesulfobacteriota bacterium]
MREKIGRYQILRKVGRGGMSDVFKAVDPADRMVVAVKLLRPFEALLEMVGYDRLEELFVVEAETMSYLDHPAVTDVLDVGRDEEGKPYFVMEFLCNNIGKMIGESFRPDQRTRQISPAKVCDYGSQLLEGLAHIHKYRVVHRDIKPGNVMVSDDERLRICDFGMALVDEVSFSGPEGVQIGSPFYVAPEQQREPGRVDGRADLYSAGVLLQRMLTGMVPSSLEAERATVLFPESGWEVFFARALDSDPAGRFQSAGEMREALARLRPEDCKGKSPGPARGPGREIAVPRKEPVNVCGKEALAVFGLNELHQPEKSSANYPAVVGAGKIIDRTTGLAWQAGISEEALTFGEAGSYIDCLNKEGFGGRDNWRLPTVSELLSLLDFPWLGIETKTKPRQGWLWSSDLHGRQDAWYVNLEMGYADWQDVGCRNFVRAVADEG